MDTRLVLQSTYFTENFKGSGPYKGEKGVATELKAQLSSNKLGRSVKLLAQLRELTPFLQDQGVFNDDYLSMIHQIIGQVKDSDNDGRKALRLVYYHVTEVSASLALGGQPRGTLLNDVYEAVLGDISSSSSCPPHRHLALRTAGMLYHILDDQRQPLEKLMRAIEDINNKCKSVANTIRPTGKMLKKATKEFTETTFLASAVASILRRLRTCPPNYMLLTVALCCIDNDDASRGAFAALARFMTQDPESVSVHLHPKLRSTSDPQSEAPMTLTLRDTLACVYYLRVCAHMAFVVPVSARHTERMRDDFYLTLVKSVGDTRLRVSLEAVRELFGYGLQSYQRLAAMGLAAVEARQLGPSPLTKCRECLIAALQKARETNDLPALHSILRVVLLILRVVQEGNARCPFIPNPPGASARGTPVLVDFFAPQSPALHTTQPYGDDMKALGKAVLSGEAGLFKSSHACIRATTLRILIWHAPPRTHVGGSDVWSSLRSRLELAIDCLLDFQLAQLLQDLLDRLDLHREQSVNGAIAVTVLSVAEHYFKRAPSDSTASLVLKVWGHCLGRHAVLSAPLVLASIFAVLDHNITDVKTLNARSSSIWEQQGMSAPGLSEARSALARLKRLALLFLRHYITAFPVEHLLSVLLRLQMLSLYADYHTRCCAVSALCRAALQLENLDVKFGIYEFLHALEVAEFDLNTCPDVKEEVSSLPVVQGQAVDYLDQGGALCMKDIIAPTMLQLRNVLERLVEQQQGGTPSLGPGAFEIVGMPPRAASPTGIRSTSPVMLPPRVVQASPSVVVESKTMEGLLDFF